MGEDAEFKYEFNMIPVSASILFGLAIGIPLGIKMVILALGEGGESSVNLLHGVGIYAYSYSSFLISAFLCGIIHVQWV